MNSIIALLVLISAACVVQQTNAWWGGWGLGLGGFGGYYGGLGLGYGFGWPYYGFWRRDVQGGVVNVTQCAYIRDHSIISCHRPSHMTQKPDIVECDTVFKNSSIAIDYDAFGVGAFNESIPVVDLVLNLFPRFNFTLLDDVVVNKIGEEVWGLYYSDKYDFYGFRVKDLDCYGKLIDLFEGLPKFEFKLVNGKDVQLIAEVIVP
jgi:hypothetical protein